MIKELENLKSTQLDAGLIFSGKSSNKTVTGYDKPSSFTPIGNPYYVFHDSSRDVIVWLCRHHRHFGRVAPQVAGKRVL